MTLTPWRVVGLILVAVALVAVALLDVVAPAAPVSCASADRSKQAHLLEGAEKAYLKVFAKEAKSQCAKEGIERVSSQWCERGSFLRKEGATAEAVKAYTAALNLQPWIKPKPKPNCALHALGEINSTTTVTECPHALKVPCNATVVNVYGVNGRNGLNGKNGANGLNGSAGAPGRPGHNGENGHNGHNGRNGLNGHNGANGMTPSPSPCEDSGCS